MDLYITWRFWETLSYLIQRISLIIIVLNFDCFNNNYCLIHKLEWPQLFLKQRNINSSEIILLWRTFQRRLSLILLKKLWFRNLLFKSTEQQLFASVLLVVASELHFQQLNCFFFYSELQGVKAGLLSRLNQQEHTIMQLQSDTLKQEFLQQQHKSEITQLQWQLTEKEKEVANLRNQLLHREKTVDKQRAELEEAARHMEELRLTQVC